MRNGMLSGMLWALDTTIMGFALAALLLTGSQGAIPAIAAVLIGALLHDASSALWVGLINGVRKRISVTRAALGTPGGRRVALGALLGGPVGMTGYVIAISYIGSAYTAVLTAFYPAFGAVMAFFLLRDRLSLLQFFGLTLAISGIVGIGYLTTTNDATASNPFLGLLGAGLAIIGWGAEAVVYASASQTSEIDTDIALQIRQSTSALIYTVVLIPLLIWWKFPLSNINLNDLWLFAVAALVGTLSYYCYYSAIEKIGPTRAMGLNISYSAWAVVFSALITLTMPSWWSVLLCLLIICGSTMTCHKRTENN